MIRFATIVLPPQLIDQIVPSNYIGNVKRQRTGMNVMESEATWRSIANDGGDAGASLEFSESMKEGAYRSFWLIE